MSDILPNSYTKTIKLSGNLSSTSKPKITTNKVCEAFIADDDKIVNDVSFKRGELGVIMEGREFCFISNGNLIIFTNDKTKYSLNSSGELIYTY